MLDVEPGKEAEFRRLSRWLALSHRLDQLIETSAETPAGRTAVRDRIYVEEKLRELERDRLARRPPPLPVSRAPGPSPLAAWTGSLRARFAARLARFALALHREAAEAGLRPDCETPR